VVTVVAVAAGQSVSIRRTVESELTRRWERVRPFDQFESDLRSELAWLKDTSKTIAFPQEPDHLVEILGLAEVPDQESLMRRRLPARIVYLIEEDISELQTKRVVRQIHFLTQTLEVVARETLATGLQEAWIEVHTQQGWSSVPDAGSNEPERPDAVRLLCQWGGEPLGAAQRTVVIGRNLLNGTVAK
jgi:hypothetical protein